MGPWTHMLQSWELHAAKVESNWRIEELWYLEGERAPGFPSHSAFRGLGKDVYKFPPACQPIHWNLAECLPWNRMGVGSCREGVTLLYIDQVYYFANEISSLQLKIREQSKDAEQSMLNALIILARVCPSWFAMIGTGWHHIFLRNRWKTNEDLVWMLSAEELPPWQEGFALWQTTTFTYTCWRHTGDKKYKIWDKKV